METLPVSTRPQGLIPTDFEQAYRMAKIMSASGLMPKGIQTPEAVFVAMQMGAEIGLSPMASVQNIAVINGRPGIYGDAALAVVRASGQLEEFKEWSEGERKTPAWKFFCRLKRKGFESVTGSYSWPQAVEAGLDRADPHSPWRKWTDRMMQFKARNFPLRDQFADFLKGIRTSEENYDAVDAEYTSEPMNRVTPAPILLKDKLNKKIEELSVKLTHAPPDIQSEDVQPAEEVAPVESQTIEESKQDDPWAEFRTQFIKLQAPGFSTFVFKNKDRFAACPGDILKEAIAKWSKFYPGNDWPFEVKQPGNGSAPPVSYTPEYKSLMELKNQFPEFYIESKNELNIAPDSVSNCINLSALISRKVDAQAALIDDSALPEYKEPEVSDTSGF